MYIKEIMSTAMEIQNEARGPPPPEEAMVWFLNLFCTYFLQDLTQQSKVLLFHLRSVSEMIENGNVAGFKTSARYRFSSTPN